ncbi:MULTISPECIES: FadR/GntR family transcriptional regulator [unclassified Cytobacillus]|uniref:FadR/GntR family transcriptional regulator n=1 Tax=unclassified Cytobacillus TaxID=2675268 RepID=UPI00203DE34C|nr:FadR/GntR family transcriptional regulator [Cytobacillus sp. AMY 15.2]MCM3092263.1 FadR family transcriptional regulator [Cytobacillus sp. AMY 15.2]
MNVKKISTRKISEIAAEQIEDMIVKGSFSPGDKLPSVRELCELFGVGRSAVRDALTSLQGKGIVQVKQGEGTYITRFDSSKLFNNPHLHPDIKDIQELFQARKMVETGLAEMAASNRSEEDLEMMKRLISDEAIHGWEEDYQFHMVIARAAGNNILIQFVQFISETLKKSMIDFHHYLETRSDMARKIEEQHLEIYLSIKNKQPNQAHKNMVDHLELVEKLLQMSILQEQ